MANRGENGDDYYSVRMRKWQTREKTATVLTLYECENGKPGRKRRRLLLCTSAKIANRGENGDECPGWIWVFLCGGMERGKGGRGEGRRGIRGDASAPTVDPGRYTRRKRRRSKERAGYRGAPLRALGGSGSYYAPGEGRGGGEYEETQAPPQPTRAGIQEQKGDELVLEVWILALKVAQQGTFAAVALESR